LSQSLIDLLFFRRNSARQNSSDFHVKSPKLVDGHQIKIAGFHGHIPKNRSSARISAGRSELRGCAEAAGFFCCAIVMAAPMIATSKATADNKKTERGAIRCSHI
jgi:hypothetical protein